MSAEPLSAYDHRACIISYVLASQHAQHGSPGAESARQDSAYIRERNRHPQATSVPGDGLPVDLSCILFNVPYNMRPCGMFTTNPNE